MKLRHQILCVLLAVAMLIGALPFPYAHAATSELTLVLTDSYGDGWNGNQIALYMDGVFHAAYTISKGSDATYKIPYDFLKTYEFRWIKGTYSNECSFQILLDSEVLLDATKNQCDSYADGQVLLMLEGADYDLEGEFAGGTGTAADPYLIATKQQLDHVRLHPNAHFKQVMDIYFTADDFSDLGAFYNDGQGWESIGNANAPFYGVYDGNGHSITGLTITRNVTEDHAYIGLFGCVYGDIANVTLSDISYTVSGQSAIYIGGIAGCAYNNEVIGCYVSGKIEAVGDFIGGVVGAGSTLKFCTGDVSLTAGGTCPNVGGVAGICVTLLSCVNNGDVSADCGNATVGGIVGSLSGYIAKCENTGAVIGVGEQTYVGGIVGNFSSGASTSVVAECVNRGVIFAGSPADAYTAMYSYAGGIVGRAEAGSIRDCYVTNDVTLTAEGNQEAMAGGIIGLAGNDVTVTNCYTLVNDLSANSEAAAWGKGGIAGHNYGTISNCYYLYTYGVGYNIGTASITRVSKLSNYANQSTYLGFDFISTWQMGTDDDAYAVLRMENGHAHSLTHYEATAIGETSGILEHWCCADCNTYFWNSEATLYATAQMLAWCVDILYGDANGDEEVDGKDLMLLRRYMANYNFSASTSDVEVEAGADTNGDGEVNGKDLMLMRKYMANYNFSTGESTVVLGPTA